jgi:hypothetical protein
VVFIDGQLAAADLGEIQRIQGSTAGKVVLNLSGLDTCSDDGILLLKGWLAGGAQLERANPFLRMLLQNEERV